MKKIFDLCSKYREIIVYIIFGVLTTVVSLVTYYLLTITLLNPSDGFQLQVANVISWIVSVIFAYVVNRKYVFRSKNDKILKEMGTFCGSRVFTLFVDMFVMYIGVSVIKGNHIIVKIISQVIVIVSNYIISKFFVFKGNN